MSYPPNYGPPPYQGYPPGAWGYIPAPVMLPYPPPPVYPPHDPGQDVHVVDNPPPAPEIIDWLPVTPSTASSLTGRALVVGREGWDGSPLWAIRAHHNGDLVPGKLAAKHQAAYIPHAGMEVPVHNFEVLCAPSNQVRWVPAGHGQVPVGAVIAGNTESAEPLYLGRVRHRGSITPGKILKLGTRNYGTLQCTSPDTHLAGFYRTHLMVHPSHGCCYISFSGSELPFKNYEVLCKISGY